MARVGNRAILKLETVLPAHRSGLICKTSLVQSFVQPVTTSITREDSACPIATVGGRSKSNNQQSCCRVSKIWNGPAPVFPVPIRSSLFGDNPLAVLSQAGTTVARDDLAIHLFPVRNLFRRHSETLEPMNRRQFDDYNLRRLNSCDGQFESLTSLPWISDGRAS